MRSIEFDPAAFEDLAWWAQQDRSQAIRIIRLVADTQRDPFAGIGKPEPLKHELADVGPGASTRSIVWSTKYCQRRFVS